MAAQHHKSEQVLTKPRRYTVGYIRDWKTHNKATSITLKGAWLDDAGFETGTLLKVRVMPGSLILTALEPAPESPVEPEVVTTLKQASRKLSDRKQREIAAFIELVATPQKRPRKMQEGAVEWRSI